MLLLSATNVEQNIFPAVFAAIVALLGIGVQFYVGISGNNLVIKSISKTKKIESFMQFYRPFDMQLCEILSFLENHTSFDFDKTQYQNVNYCEDLKELQCIYSKIYQLYSENYEKIYPESEELDKLIIEMYNL